MPTLTTKTGREYQIDGRYLVWTTEPWEDEEPTTLRLPLRVKLGPILRIAEGADLEDNATQLQILLAVAPLKRDELEEMDVNDFRTLFAAWMAAYQTMSGATLGE